MGRLSEPPFSRIAIVGLGLIGGSIALAIRRRWPSAVIVAVDRQPVVDTALELRIVDEGGVSLDAAAGAALVMLAAPVLQNAAALSALPAHLESAVVTDAGSTKRTMEEAAAGLPEGLIYIGGHPLAGAAVSGVEAARPDLFDDRPWILTPSRRLPPKGGSHAEEWAPGGSRSEEFAEGGSHAEGRAAAALELLSEFVAGLRAVPQIMDAETHDRLLAYLSHLPQLTVSALMHVVGAHAGPDGLALAGRGLRDTTRLASSPAPPWRDIVATNGDNIASAIDDLIAALQELKADAAQGGTHLERMFVSAARWKGVLEHS
jgi:prephenate dehydrogenase